MGNFRFRSDDGEVNWGTDLDVAMPVLESGGGSSKKVRGVIPPVENGDQIT
jgi:hypothetical protein